TGSPRKSSLGRAYDRIDPTMTLVTVQSIVGRPPDISPRPPAMQITFVQELYFFPLPECDTATWRDLDQSLLVYYSTEPDRHIVGKSFFVDPDLSDYDGSGGWRRVSRWVHKILR